MFSINEPYVSAEINYRRERSMAQFAGARAARQNRRADRRRASHRGRIRQRASGRPALGA